RVSNMTDARTAGISSTADVAGAPLAGAGEAHRFLGGAHQGARFLYALLVLGLEIRISDDADTRLHVHGVVLHQARAQQDAGVHRAIGREITGAAGIHAAAHRLDLVDDLHGAHFGGA